MLEPSNISLFDSEFTRNISASKLYEAAKEVTIPAALTDPQEALLQIVTGGTDTTPAINELPEKEQEALIESCKKLVQEKDLDTVFKFIIQGYVSRVFKKRNPVRGIQEENNFIAEEVQKARALCTFIKSIKDISEMIVKK
jgi:hypothetical protein